MSQEQRSLYEYRARLRLALLLALLAASIVLGIWYMRDLIPRRIVLASGVATASYHLDAQQYIKILEREHVTVIEKLTGGAGENAALLLDPRSGVDVAFMEGGVFPRKDRDKVMMLAALRYEPVWVFYRGDETVTRLEQLRYRRIAVGSPGNGGRVIVEPMLEASNVTQYNTRLLSIGGNEALRALRAGDVDAAIMVGATRSPIIWQALHDDSLKLMSYADADAYARRFPFLTTLTLPAATIDMAYRRIPPETVRLVATKAMLVARPDLPPAIANLLLDAARDLHSEHGYFEGAEEFPSIAAVDLPVSSDAERHFRFGPSFLHRHMPYWVATFLERMLVVVLPIVVIFVPLFNLLPQFLRWRVRSRIFRWYGELKLLEQEIERSRGDLPIERWLSDLERIERAAGQIRTPASFASESYTLREHIALVRRAIVARTPNGKATPAESG
jgi:TRAP-type uncharacterized transport system substrate-binding protein